MTSFIIFVFVLVECDKLHNLCICSNEKKTIFLSFTVLHFVRLSVLTQIYKFDISSSNIKVAFLLATLFSDLDYPN